MNSAQFHEWLIVNEKFNDTRKCRLRFDKAKVCLHTDDLMINISDARKAINIIASI